ncbi:MAG: aldo/keto reductase, partial [Planctomycetota bacterium]
MRYREFGETGIEVSEVGVGCGGLGGERKQGLEPAVERALELGVNLFDTCDTYAESRSEQTLGRVFRNHRRDEFVVCTKFGGVIEDGEWHRDVSVPHLREAFEASCRRLGVDFLDIYLVHTPPADLCRHDDLIAELDQMVNDGKIRAYGVSTESGAFAGQVCDCSAAKAIEITFNLFYQDPRNGFLDRARADGIGIVCKAPMANGVLTDSFVAESPPPDDKYLKRFGEERWARRADLWQQVRPILTANGRTMAQGALAWLLSFPEVSTVIPGISSPERIEETAAASDRPLTDDELAALDAVADGSLANA